MIDLQNLQSAICNKNKLKIEEARQYAIPRVAVNILIVKIPGKDFVLFYNFYHLKCVHTAYHKPELLNFTFHSSQLRVILAYLTFTL